MRFTNLALGAMLGVAVLAASVGCSFMDDIDTATTRSMEMEQRLQSLMLQAETIHGDVVAITALIQEVATFREHLLLLQTDYPEDQRLYELSDAAADLIEELVDRAEHLQGSVENLQAELAAAAEFQSETSEVLRRAQQDMQMLRLVQGLTETITGRRIGPPRPTPSENSGIMDTAANLLPWAIPFGLPLMSRRFRGWAGRKAGKAVGSTIGFIGRLGAQNMNAPAKPKEVGPRTPLAPTLPFPMYHPGAQQAAGAVGAAGQKIQQFGQQVQQFGQQVPGYYPYPHQANPYPNQNGGPQSPPPDGRHLPSEENPLPTGGGYPGPPPPTGPGRIPFDRSTVGAMGG